MYARDRFNTSTKRKRVDFYGGIVAFVRSTRDYEGSLRQP